MQVIAHIGFHKTGTTSFQDLIRANLNLLPSHVVVEVRGRPFADEVHRASEHFHVKPSPQNILNLKNALDAMLANAVTNNAKVLFISLEDLSGLASLMMPHCIYNNVKPVLQLMRQSTQSHELKVLFSTRAWDDWVRSLHAHITKHGDLQITYQAFADAIKERDLNWSELISTITEGLNLEIAVSSLEDTKDTRLGALSDFLLEFLTDEQLQSWVPVPKSNIGLSPALVSFAQNRTVGALPRTVRKYLIKYLHSITKRLGFASLRH